MVHSKQDTETVKQTEPFQVTVCFIELKSLLLICNCFDFVESFQFISEVFVKLRVDFYDDSLLSLAVFVLQVFLLFSGRKFYGDGYALILYLCCLEFSLCVFHFRGNKKVKTKEFIKCLSNWIVIVRLRYLSECVCRCR